MAVPDRGRPDPLDHTAACGGPVGGREGARCRGLAPRAARVSPARDQPRRAPRDPRRGRRGLRRRLRRAPRPWHRRSQLRRDERAGARRQLPARDRHARPRPEPAAAPRRRDASRDTRRRR